VPTRDRQELERRLTNVTERLLAAFEELDFVYSMARVLGRPEGVRDIDTYLLEETLSLFGADGGWISRIGAEGSLHPTSVRNLETAVVEGLDRHLVGPLAVRGELPFLVDDLPGSLARQPQLLEGARRGDLPGEESLPRAMLAVPLEVSTEVLGVVCLGKRNPGDVFTAGDSKLLSTLAIQAALYMKNADLLERLRAEARSLGRRVQELESDPRTRPRLELIDGPSRGMHRVAEQVKAAASTDATVLLLGESGTGKSLVARILHRLSRRQSGSFVEVNCGAVPPGLIESELFGHARGAFTGADRARAGLFEEADRGTLFLDEVAELPLEAQVKLLTVLEQHRVRRVGENRDRSVDVRVVAATNADLAAAVKEGKFREDVFYRLNVISLTIPPLRQRPEDILHLGRIFLRELSRETNRRVAGFSPEAEDALLSYAWPGNVRELRNVVERALLMKAGGDRMEAADLPLQAGAEAPVARPPRLESALPEALEAYEKSLILEALHEAGGVVARAADRLGISRTNLHNKLKKHDLARSSTWNDESQKS
jgi:two-component system response regulator AtoC